MVLPATLSPANAYIDIRPDGKFLQYALFKPVLSVRFSERSLRRYERLVRAETIRERDRGTAEHFCVAPRPGTISPVDNEEK
jgi:hypothetical protein